MSASAVAARHRERFDAIGTLWSIDTAERLDVHTRAEIDATVAAYDATWSRFRADSVVSRLADAGGTVEVGIEGQDILGLLGELAERTAGAMTPLIGRAMEHVGYDANYALVPRPGFRAAEPPRALHLDGTRVTLTEPALIDVGAAGKGQLVDQVIEVLARAGHTDVLVDASGDLRTFGAPVAVALEHPYDPSRAIGVLDVADAALCGSAVNRRSWDSHDGRGRLHHVLDGRTGMPVREFAATWVLAETALVADALATALFFVEPGRVADLGLLGFVRMTTDGRVEASADLPGQLFS